jgi:hypothetical protein
MSSTRKQSANDDKPLTNASFNTMLIDALKQQRKDIQSDINAEFAKLRETITDQASHINKLESIVKSQQTFILSQQRKATANNVIISGLSETNNDTAMVNDILTAVDCKGKAIDNIHRIGVKTNDKPRLLRVIFTNVYDKHTAIRGASKLRNNTKFKGVYLNSDYPPLDIERRTNAFATKPNLSNKTIQIKMSFSKRDPCLSTTVK